METDLPAGKLFGSQTRAAILKFFLDHAKKQFSVNDVIRKAKVNGKLASPELKKLTELSILIQQPRGNSLLHQLNENSYFAKPLQEIFAEHDWFEWERPSRIHHLVLTLEAGLKPMKKYYGYSLPPAHLVFNYDNVTWFFKLSDFRTLGKQLIPAYLQRKKQVWANFENFASTLWNQPNYESFYKNYLDFWKVAYITEPISMYIDSLLKPGEKLSIQNRSFTDDYESQLWELAQVAKKVGLARIDVKPLIKNYFWIRNSYYGIHRLTEEEVKTEIGKKMDKQKPRPKFIQDPTSLSKDILSVGKDMILMQDIRKKYMMKAAYYLHEFLKQIGQKYDLTPAMMAQTVPQEVLHISPKSIPKLTEELKMRQRSCTITGDLASGIKVYSGQTFFPTGSSRKAKLEIRGQVACGGKAVGRAKIIKNIEEMYKVNHGDIIVSPMTSPDLMPAIRRAVAIVTDFGGMTCHAAIISREFNIPCIVGTDAATEVIRDEDLIEVDANNGLVRILQSSG